MLLFVDIILSVIVRRHIALFAWATIARLCTLFFLDVQTCIEGGLIRIKFLVPHIRALITASDIFAAFFFLIAPLTLQQDLCSKMYKPTDQTAFLPCSWPVSYTHLTLPTKA